MLHQLPPLSLYIHYPWCVSKCPYCDFNSHQAVANNTAIDKHYIDALIKDLDNSLTYVQGRTIESIFIGGGTPSLIDALQLARFFGVLNDKLNISAQAEITIEVNPNSATLSKLTQFFQLGINRLSIGGQSFQPQHLKALGRAHHSQDIIDTVNLAQQAGFENINIDLMYGLPEQTLDEAHFDIEQLLALKTSHISYYQLTIEPNTFFAKYPPKLSDDDLSYQMMIAAKNSFKQSGYQQYEVSAFAKAGKACWHNVNYWLFGDYIGLGAGAHGKITDINRQTIVRSLKSKAPHTYLKTQQEKTTVVTDLAFEFMLNALRLNQGFEIDLLKQRAGLSFDDIKSGFDKAYQLGLLTKKDQTIVATANGFDFLNDVQLLFLPQDCQRDVIIQ